MFDSIRNEKNTIRTSLQATHTDGVEGREYKRKPACGNLYVFVEFIQHWPIRGQTRVAMMRSLTLVTKY